MAAHRELPGHIAAALAGAGGPADSAGRPWEGRSLAGDDAHIHNFEHDDGEASPALAAALAALRDGSGGEAGVLAALATARVFIPIVAQLAEEGEGHDGLHADKQADMALVTIKAPDGRMALPVFSSAGALERWHPEARPVATYAARAALSAVSEQAQLMVLDPGSDFTFVVRRAPLWALAQQKEWTPSYEDPAVAEAFRASGQWHPAVGAIQVRRGSGVVSRDAQGVEVAGGGIGPELCVELGLRPGLDSAQVSALVSELQRNWAGNETLAEGVDSIEVKVTLFHD
ncbi:MULTISPECIES: SseB family protein [Arthrobacter]|uniref:SseB family protein n=2 Tax=Arthrobacter TaxID=1663 RepID=A0ABU9KM57_9MICC|nr:SseB family protein [Arthrobacter sp. YJM1]MDP5227871.1 SseB family protein [Arthrobacter sp. YJM1]